MDDGRAEDVRAPQAASVAGNRRKTTTLAVTTTSQTVPIRSGPADSEAWFTLYSDTAAVTVAFHVGPSTIPVAVLANDWILPPQTERNYKLAHGETHISIVSSAPTNVKLYLSSD